VLDGLAQREVALQAQKEEPVPGEEVASQEVAEDGTAKPEEEVSLDLATLTAFSPVEEDEDGFLSDLV